MAIDSIWVTENSAGTICSTATEYPGKELDSYDKPWIRFDRVGENRVVFVSEAHPVEVDGHSMTGVWTDGLMLSSDNGKSPWMPGVAPHAIELKSGKKYRVIVEEIE